MKKLIAMLAGTLLIAASAQATVVLSDNFDDSADGALTGQSADTGQTWGAWGAYTSLDVGAAYGRSGKGIGVAYDWSERRNTISLGTTLAGGGAEDVVVLSFDAERGMGAPWDEAVDTLQSVQLTDTVSGNSIGVSWTGSDGTIPWLHKISIFGLGLDAQVDAFRNSWLHFELRVNLTTGETQLTWNALDGGDEATYDVGIFNTTTYAFAPDQVGVSQRRVVVPTLGFDNLSVATVRAPALMLPLIPEPKDHGYVPDGDAVLSWTPQAPIPSASYDVYFGTNYNAVNDNAVLLADLDRNGLVGESDLEILAGQWLADPGITAPSADFDGDGIVDMADFAVMAGQWQQSSSSTYKGNQTATNYNPTGTLDYGVYYWRVDEVDGDFGHVKKGQTWKVTVGDVIYIGVIKYINIVDPAANRTPLEQIITDLGGGDALRKGTYYDAQLIVSSDMGPNATHLGPGSYDFSKYIAYAELCKELGIKWSLQLSYHYAPGWYTTQCITDYGYDPRVRNEAGEVANGHFMPFSPSSPVWGDYCKDWAEAAVEALAPYMGTVIDDIMPGNEMMCNINIPTSYDEYTKQAWKDYTGNPSATLPIGFASTAQFQEFRSIQWYNAMKTLVDDVKNKTKTLGKSVKVSTKLVPYMLHSTWMLRSGIFPKVFDLIEEDSMDVIVVDFYPPTSHYYQTLYRRDKPMYLAEFNKGGGADCTAAEIEGWIQDGVTNYNMKYATFFAWDASGDIWDITEEEKTGLKNAADWVLTLSGPIVQKTDVVRYNISTAVLGEDADTAWTLNSDSNKRMRAAMALTGVLNPLSSVAYEIGVGGDPDAEVNIYQITEDTTIADTTTDKAIYLIENPDTTINITHANRYVTTASSSIFSNASYLLRNTQNLLSGTQIYGSTPKWSSGNRKLTTNLSGYTRYVDTYNGYPLAIRKDNTFFLGQDTAWEIVDGGTDTPLDQLIADMLYDLGID